jgi:hypothetical protein
MAGYASLNPPYGTETTIRYNLEIAASTSSPRNDRGYSLTTLFTFLNRLA